MKINIAIKSLDVQIADESDRTVFHYTLDNYALNADGPGLIAAALELKAAYEKAIEEAQA